MTMVNVEWPVESPLAKISFEVGPHHENHQKKKSAAIPVHSHFVQYLGQAATGDASYHLRFNGAEHKISVRSLKEHRLYQHMLKPEVKDHSNLVLSPMPGTIISCSKKSID
jgi:acetyl/propionyl-CoA carboxylase alpha subunit